MHAKKLIVLRDYYEEEMLAFSSFKLNLMVVHEKWEGRTCER